MTDQTEKFESWGLLELFGHQRIAGKLSEQSIGGCHFIRVDVPEVSGVSAYTRFFTQGAIYAMTPMDEATARKLAAYLRAVPVSPYEVRAVDPAPQIPNSSDDEPDDEAPPVNSGAESIECGATYEGVVIRNMDFGAVVRIGQGVNAMLHISEIAHQRVDNVADYLADGQIVRVKVIEINEIGRVHVSMKALIPAPITEDDRPF